MFYICVLEPEGGGILDFVRKAVTEDCVFDHSAVRRHYDLVLWHGGKIGDTRANVLAVLDECGHLAAKHVSAPVVITYGMSHKNTLTVSSDMEKRVLTLQREIKTLGGKVISPMEIPVTCALPLCEAMGAVTACIMCKPDF